MLLLFTSSANYILFVRHDVSLCLYILIAVKRVRSHENLASARFYDKHLYNFMIHENVYNAVLGSVGGHDRTEANKQTKQKPYWVCCLNAKYYMDD